MMHESDQTIEVLQPTQFSQEEIDENFRIHSEIDIVFILRGIMQTNSLITLYPNYENDFILTSIIAIDPDKKEMIVDYGTNERNCQKALQSISLVFVTTQNRVKIEFVCDQIKKIQYKGENAFAVNIPRSLLRIQRRNHFRISTPIVKPLKCVIPITGKDTISKAEVALLDISCGGIAVIDQHPIINFDPGIIYKKLSNCASRNWHNQCHHSGKEYL